MKQSNFFNSPATSTPQSSQQTAHSPSERNQNPQMNNTSLECLSQNSVDQQPSSKIQAFARSANIVVEYSSELRRVSSQNEWYSSLESPFQAYYDRQKKEVKDEKMDNKRTFDEAEILSDDEKITTSSDNKGNAEGKKKEESEPSPQDSSEPSPLVSTEFSSQDEFDDVFNRFNAFTF